MNDLIVSGLETNHRSYARVTATEEANVEPREAEQTSLEEQVVAFLGSKDITIDSRDIEGCHLLPRKDKKMKPAIIIRFANRKSKTALLKQGKKLKGTNVYVNENLTKKNADIASRARFLRRLSRIQSTWTSNCKVFIKLNGRSPEEAKVLVIKELADLDRYQ